MIYNVEILSQTFQIEAKHPKIAGKKALKLWLKDNKPKCTYIKTSVYNSEVDKNGYTDSSHYDWRVK